jgi:hypothetical protein
MLRITGSPKTLCDGMTRRDLLQIGGLTSLGLSLSAFLRLKEAQAETPWDHTTAGFGKAKACILIHLFGAPPQHETFDPKPLAPAEIQGELKAISTSLPGVEIGEGLPQVAQILDRTTVIRSLTHALPFHGVHYAISGIPEISQTVEADPNDRTLWPCIGSVFDFIAEQRSPGAPLTIPRNIAMPYVLYSRCQFRPLGGPYAGFLGSRYDPIWTDFSARGTRPVPKPLDRADVDVYDPFGGIHPEDKLGIAGPSGIAESMSPERLGLRRALMQQFDERRRWLDRHERVRSFDRFQELAWSLVTTSDMAQALDIQKEPAAVREQYGMTLFGQSLLAARRMIQAGGRFLTVFWDAYGHFTGGWDTHYQHYPRLKEFLLPVFDQAFSALILDLEAQGLLDETLVLCISEHGRTPKISTNVKGGGREHWSRVYSGLMAGGGVARGHVVGESDAIGGDVAQTPISPKDVLATSLHLLGIDAHTTIPDQQNRPWPVAGAGIVRQELLA